MRGALVAVKRNVRGRSRLETSTRRVAGGAAERKIANGPGENLAGAVRIHCRFGRAGAQRLPSSFHGRPQPWQQYAIPSGPERSAKGSGWPKAKMVSPRALCLRVDWTPQPRGSFTIEPPVLFRNTACRGWRRHA